MTILTRRVNFEPPINLDMSPEATPLLMMDNGVASSDILLYGITRGDADALALLDCQHYHGLLKWPPFRRLPQY